MEIITEEGLKVLDKYLKLLADIKLIYLDFHAAVSTRDKAIAESKRGELTQIQHQAETLEKQKVVPLFEEIRKALETNKKELFYPKTLAYLFMEGAENAYPKFKEVFEEINNNKYLDLALRC
jgi:hypothetical protein